MFSHVHVGITDFTRSYAFYAAVFRVLGFEVRVCRPGESWTGWAAPGTQKPLFFIGLPFDRTPANPGNGQMTAFLAPTRGVVVRCPFCRPRQRWTLRGVARTSAAVPGKLLRYIFPGPRWKQDLCMLPYSSD